jgi:predicted RNase H-like HicB family nuclease
MSDELRLSVRFEQGDDGFTITSVPEVPGTLSQGRTREEARAKVVEALRLMLSREPCTPEGPPDR